MTAIKRKLHHYWRFVRPIKARYFLLIAVVFFGVSVFALRHNNQRSVELRDHLLQVDKENGDVEGALRDLRQHIYSHMNSELGGVENTIGQPIQLVYTYQRLVEAESDRVSEENSSIYNNAQAYCEREYPDSFFGAGRLGCIEDYVEQRGVEFRDINEDLYKFDFASPVWSPDLAGWSLVLGAIFTLLFVIRFIAERWVKASL